MAAPRATMWSMPGPCLRVAAELVDHDRPGSVDVEVARQDRRRIAGEAGRPAGGADELGVRDPRVPRLRRVQVRHDHPALQPDGHALPAFLAPGEHLYERQSQPAALAKPEPRGIQGQDMPGENPAVGCDENRVRLPLEAGPQQAGVQVGDRAAERDRRRQRPDRRPGGDLTVDLHSTPLCNRLEGPRRHLLKADDVRVVLGHEPDHLLHVAPPPGRHGVAVEDVPGPDDHGGTVGTRCGGASQR